MIDTNAAYKYADSLLFAKLLGEERKRRIVAITLEEFENEKGLVSARPRSFINNRVKRTAQQRIEAAEPKGFLSVIIMALAGFLIQKLLAWLWEKYAPTE
jgi:hypothetical protein